MNAVLLISIILSIAVQHFSQKNYQIKVKGGTFIFSCGAVFFALLFFIVSSGGKIILSTDYLLYSLGFALFYGIGSAFTVLSIKEGPLSLTSLIISMSLIIPSVYGILFLGEPTSLTLFIGIALLLVSLALINIKSGGNEKKINLKWVFYVSLAFIGNGGCSTVQRVQQINQEGKYKNELMICALLIVVITMLVLSLLFERKTIKISIKKGIGWFTLYGLANGMLNLFVIILGNRMPVSVMFPVMSAGGIITTFILSLCVFKEKLAPLQYIGSAIGLVSIVFLNI